MVDSDIVRVVGIGLGTGLLAVLCVIALGCFYFIYADENSSSASLGSSVEADSESKQQEQHKYRSSTPTNEKNHMKTFRSSDHTNTPATASQTSGQLSSYITIPKPNEYNSHSNTECMPHSNNNHHHNHPPRSHAMSHVNDKMTEAEHMLEVSVSRSVSSMDLNLPAPIPVPPQASATLSPSRGITVRTSPSLPGAAAVTARTSSSSSRFTPQRSMSESTHYQQFNANMNGYKKTIDDHHDQEHQHQHVQQEMLSPSGAIAHTFEMSITPPISPYFMPPQHNQLRPPPPGTQSPLLQHQPIAHRYTNSSRFRVPDPTSSSPTHARGRLTASSPRVSPSTQRLGEPYGER